MTHEEFLRAENYWKEHDAESAGMDPALLRKAAEEYIQANDTCALATGSGETVRCTPIEYTYHDGAFWMFSEGGEKFACLEHNRHVCLAVFDKYAGFGKLKGLQISGRAELPELFSDEYVRAAAYRKIPLETLRKLSHPMILIKIIPERAEFLNSEFKKQGFDSRQCLEFR